MKIYPNTIYRYPHLGLHSVLVLEADNFDQDNWPQSLGGARIKHDSTWIEINLNPEDLTYGL